MHRTVGLERAKQSPVERTWRNQSFPRRVLGNFELHRIYHFGLAAILLANESSLSISSLNLALHLGALGERQARQLFLWSRQEWLMAQLRSRKHRPTFDCILRSMSARRTVEPRATRVVEQTFGFSRVPVRLLMTF